MRPKNIIQLIVYTVDRNTNEKYIRRDPASILDALKTEGKSTSRNHGWHNSLFPQICSTKGNKCLFLFLISLQNGIQIKHAYNKKFKECFPQKSWFGCTDTSCHINGSTEIGQLSRQTCPQGYVATKFELSKKGSTVLKPPRPREMCRR